MRLSVTLRRAPRTSSGAMAPRSTTHFGVPESPTIVAMRTACEFLVFNLLPALFLPCFSPSILQWPFDPYVASGRDNGDRSSPVRCFFLYRTASLVLVFWSLRGKGDRMQITALCTDFFFCTTLSRYPVQRFFSLVSWHTKFARFCVDACVWFIFVCRVLEIDTALNQWDDRNCNSSPWQFVCEYGTSHPCELLFWHDTVWICGDRQVRIWKLSKAEP